MFVNKINNITFNGYQHSIGSAGEHLYNFNYPHSKNQNVEIKIYRIDCEPDDEPIKTIKLEETNNINFSEIPELNCDENVRAITYVDGKPVEERVINRKGTFPLVQGQAILIMPDIHRPGAYYDKNGKIIYDPQKQKDSEQVIRTFSNKGGGSLAGVEYDIDMLKEMGIKKIFMTPIWGGDNRSSHKYWNKNDMQISDDMGTVDNYETFIRKSFKNGIQCVDDFAITSEGLEGIHIQDILRHAEYNPDLQYLFKLNNLNDGPIILGLAQSPNTRFKPINPSVVYDEKTKDVIANPKYNPNMGTMVQYYDKTQVSKEQLEKEDLIKNYDNAYSDNKLAINSSEDTVVPYALEIKPQEYENRLREYVKMKKQAGEEINLDSYEATMFINQYTHFKIGKEAEGAVFWDANKDLMKRNYYISGYDEKLLNAIPNLRERESIRELMKRANCTIRDMTIQAGVYRTQVVKDIQTLYVAQMLQGAETQEEINKLIGKDLPAEAGLSSEEIENIRDGWYDLEPKCVESRDDYTLKSIMKLPLDSLELGDNTVGVLSSPYFSKRAISEDTIGLSRFEFYKNGAGLYKPYCEVYHNMDNLFEDKIRDFVDDVINKVNEMSSEKLLDENKKYTEYGEYVVDLLGKEIAKYALLKAIAGDKLNPVVMPDDVLKGKISYNFDELRKTTTLKALGINASDPTEKAQKLIKHTSDGLDKLKLDYSNVNFVASAILKRIEGTTTMSFRLAEAMTHKSGLGMAFRLDAAKDVADWDAVRNGDMTFDDAWDQVIDFWKNYVEAIKKVNPNAYFVAEITDVDQLMRAQYGPNADVWNVDLSEAGGKYKNVPDALNRFFEETGITSEAAYSYTFTDLLHVFSADGEYGNTVKNPMESFKNRIESLLKSNNLDYIRNIWTFADNQDKPSVLHTMALDMELFHTNNLEPDFRSNKDSFEKENYEIRRRNARISILQELTNSDKFEDLPLEAMMNIDNKDYFRTASPRSAAMSKIMRDKIVLMNEQGGIDNKTAKALKDALVDLTNGNYLNDKENINLQTIDIPELQSVEKALDYILQKSGLTLDDNIKEAVINKAKEREMVEKYAVRGDYDWKNGDGSNHWAAEELQNRTKSVLANTEWDYMQYSPYVVSVAALLLDSYKAVSGENSSEKFVNGTREFVHNFKRETVQEHSSKLPYTEDDKIAFNKKAYAARDFETVIEMILQQTEYKTGNKFSKETHDKILAFLFEKTTENAVEKAAMYASFLAALPGIPCQFYRDMLGGLGYDEKARNVFLQNRNTVKYSELEEEGPLKAYRNKIFNTIKEIMQIRNTNGMEAINNGTPYMLDTNNKNTMAMLYQGEGDDAVISILNAEGINTKNTAEAKTDEVELSEILLPSAIALPVGMTFAQLGNPKNEFIVQLTNGISSIVKKDGGKIILNSETAKHGTMFLKKASRVAFRGSKNINKQYNFASNMYNKNKVNTVGENLSIIAK